MTIKFYTRTVCPKCMFSKMLLNNKGFEYEEINIDNNPEAEQYLKDKNYATLPVIEFSDNDVIIGNNPSKLTQKLASV